MPETLAATPVPPRVLTPPPSDVIDPATRLPLLGSYEGPLPPVDLTPLKRSLPFRVAHEKAWYYVAIATPEIFLGVAILRFGYVASTFAFLFERGPSGGPSGHFLADRSQLGPPFAARYAGDDGISFRLLNQLTRFERGAGAASFDLEIALGDFKANAKIAAGHRPSPICAIAAFGDGLVHATEKRALLTVAGEAQVGERRFSLDQGLAGFDRSHGYLPRHTMWRWAFALGHADSGERVGVNLVDSFVGEAECAVWIDDQIYPVGEGRFTFDPERPLQPWRVTSTCGAVDLTFEPGDIHAEHQNLGLVTTRFVQPVGAYSGTIMVGGRTLKLTRVLGVTEDQDARW